MRARVRVRVRVKVHGKPYACVVGGTDALARRHRVRRGPRGRRDGAQAVEPGTKHIAWGVVTATRTPFDAGCFHVRRAVDGATGAGDCKLVRVHMAKELPLHCGVVTGKQGGVPRRACGGVGA